MEYILSILRRKRNSSESYWQDFKYESKTDFDTVITALKDINSRDIITDINGKPADMIEYESSCLQKKCGACAMVINGRPMLGCHAKLSDFKSKIKVEPLRKFNVITDLVVDRSILFENLKTLKLWLEKDSNIIDKRRLLNYEASECIQCGLCLEVCPNFHVGGCFYGMSAIVLTTRLLTELSKEDRDIISKLYSKHGFSGCGKSLACKDICPKGIKTDKLLVNANLLAIWKKK